MIDQLCGSEEEEEVLVLDSIATDGEDEQEIDSNLTASTFSLPHIHIYFKVSSNVLFYFVTTAVITNYPRIDLNELPAFIPGTTVEPIVSIHHPNNPIPNLPSRELPTDEWPMGTITMEGLHAMFELSNMPPRLRNGFLSFLRSYYFRKSDVSSPTDYKETRKLQGEKAVC
jgi:hypothetical protein